MVTATVNVAERLKYSGFMELGLAFFPPSTHVGRESGKSEADIPLSAFWVYAM